MSLSGDPRDVPNDTSPERQDVVPVEPVDDIAEAPISPVPPEPEVSREPPPANPKTFIGPRGGSRRGIESVFVRLVATSGIVGICVALAAIIGTQDVAFWIIGLAVSLVSVVLAAILWSSRTL